MELRQLVLLLLPSYKEWREIPMPVAVVIQRLDPNETTCHIQPPSPELDRELAGWTIWNKQWWNTSQARWTSQRQYAEQERKERHHRNLKFEQLCVAIASRLGTLTSESFVQKTASDIILHWDKEKASFFNINLDEQELEEIDEQDPQ